MFRPLDALLRLHELSTDPDEDIKQFDIDVARERCAQEVLPWLLERYDYLSGRFGKTAVVPLVDGFCSGCHVHTPSLRRGELWEEGLCLCEHCGRILYDERKAMSLIGI